MELRRAGYVVIFVIMLCALAIASSEGRRKTINTIVGDDGSLAFSSPELDGDLVCMKASAERENAAEAEAGELRKEHIRKQELLHCLRKKTMSLDDWFIRLIEFIFGGPSIPRRHLITSNSPRLITPHSSAARAPVSSLSPSPSPGHAPVSSPIYALSRSPLSSPSPSPSFSLSPSPSPSPSLSPSPSNLPPANSPSPDLEPPAEAVADPAPPPKHHLPRPHVHPAHHQSKKHDNSQTATLATAAVGAAGVGAILIVALILLCRRNSGGRNKVDPKVGQRDERPLLNISLSELSGDSSQKSFGLGNSGTKEFNVGNGNGNKPSHVGNLMNSENGASNTESPTSGLPPLKLPPGRPDPQPPPPPPPPAPAPPPPPPPAPRAPPPPPMKVVRPPPVPVPPKAMPGKNQPLSTGPHHRGPSSSSMDGDSGSQKTKLKPFFWDKVLANPDQSMVWHEISAGSFQFNEQMMESLFGYTAAENNRTDRRKESSSEASVQYIQIIDSKKAQNLSILLRALNVTTEEVVDALHEGYAELPLELLQTLLKMAPTAEEELKLRLFSGELSQLGPAERFLKTLVETPFAFKRLEALLFTLSMEEDVSNIKESFATLEVACNKLRKSRLFLKLLEAVLKTGNRMNDGTYRGGAQAFKLDTLLKLSDVKGTDGKTTLLHFVVQEIIRSEGIRAARSNRESRSLSSEASGDSNLEDLVDDSAEHYRQLGLQVVSGLSTELEDVKKAAAVDVDGLTTTISKLSQSLAKMTTFLNMEMKNLDEDSKFVQSLTKFLEKAEADISWISEEEKKILSLVKSTTDYFHGNSGKDEGLRLFTIVRDFLIVLDKTCKQVQAAAAAAAKQAKTHRKQTPPLSSSSPTTNSDIRQRLFPAITERRIDEESSSSDDDGSSSSPIASIP